MERSSMSTSKRARSLAGIVLLSVFSCGFAVQPAAGRGAAASAGVPVARNYYGIGEAVTPAEAAPWDITVGPLGRNLPPGRGTVSEGKSVYQSECASCHGEAGQGGTGNRLVGGFGSLATSKPVKTVGSYWPFATTVFDYIRRAMPMNHPQSLTADQVYALVAYILYLNGIVPGDAVMDQRTLPAVKMPNRDGFLWSSPHPATRGVACMTNCR
jgi:S-disulfanyl-L-cysteine oxidoreductase SoxD